jgi:hypothetical protein
VVGAFRREQGEGASRRRGEAGRVTVSSGRLILM